MSAYDLLSEYVRCDEEKRSLILENQFSRNLLYQDSFQDMEFSPDIVEDVPAKFELSQTGKFCPKCGREFRDSENFCPDCLVMLKKVSDKIDIKDIKFTPEMTYEGKNEYSNILDGECLKRINEFDFSLDDLKDILFSIKSQAFKNIDTLINENSIILDELDILDKVFLFAKSFAAVEYKSYGQTLGYFESNRILVDDRQRDSLQITTLIHELTHFIMKELFTRIICTILDAGKNTHIEAVATYILNYSKLNELIDEYAAHSVEGRFTVFGYQDYSSFLSIQDNLDSEDGEIAKTIGNTFSIHIKDMMESFLDVDLRREIKERFLDDTIEQPDYRQLAFENCNRLSDEGFIKAIGLMLGKINDCDLEIVHEIESKM